MEEYRGQYTLIGEVAKALAHPTRLFILELIARKRVCVQDIVDMTSYDQSTISRHLGILASTGIVTAQRCGHRIYYRVKHPCIMNFFTCARVFLDEEHAEKLTQLRRQSKSA
ncbi:regulatory protein ArsR [Desulfurispirillum indicum S5]|uniref:Regulatory protein ArsR n=1 Tax=Desulfurispirillum indicum (strain ATCC BAA-1389 / DSM 22839 / S5) TaxID=653733 RepID=E6W1W0_DESIS|nr:metalloregulator ArsR/SmtB family transcription factor [Desulfurispirillum indicum]ADU65492.1 regulatory protein ArsR [Desulfurispirillum indicum S5]